MMYTPLNPEALVQWQLAYPSLRPVDFGFTCENYGHIGSTNNVGGGMTFFSIFDWGCGSASEAFSRITDHYGHVYIDRSRGRGFGIDSIDVSLVNGNWQLDDRTATPRKIRIVFDDGTSLVRWLNTQLTLP